MEASKSRASSKASGGEGRLLRQKKQQQQQQQRLLLLLRGFSFFFYSLSYFTQQQLLCPNLWNFYLSLPPSLPFSLSCARFLLSIKIFFRVWLDNERVELARWKPASLALNSPSSIPASCGNGRDTNLCVASASAAQPFHNAISNIGFSGGYGCSCSCSCSSGGRRSIGGSISLK